ncbi:MAG: hypothetical protein KBD63_00220 [Bacteriovoracaceae bacterium]|nr:hypothetical protein [Bacteriovoracaceae bacterium]
MKKIIILGFFFLNFSLLKAELLVLPHSSAELSQIAKKAIERTEKELVNILSVSQSEVTFANTIAALDKIKNDFTHTKYLFSLVSSIHQDKKMRKKSSDLFLEMSRFENSFNEREDIYQRVLKVKTSGEFLDHVSQRLLDQKLEDYRYLGQHLSKELKRDVSILNSQISKLTEIFLNNTQESKEKEVFKVEELEGLSENDFKKLQKNSEGYIVHANSLLETKLIYEKANQEATRKKSYFLRFNLEREANTKLALEILQKRQELAHLLGFKSWANYRISRSMHKEVDSVKRFLDQILQATEKPYQETLQEYTKQKQQDQKNLNVSLEPWDIEYYNQKSSTQKMSQVFPYEKVKKELFKIVEKIFSLKIEEINLNSEKWVDDLEAYVIKDEQEGHILGTFYLDMFTREGKYANCATFGLKPRIESPFYGIQESQSILMCNLLKPKNAEEVFLSFNNVVTFFHEFGHILHLTLSKAPYFQLAGTNVIQDFVEAPSKLLEFLPYQKEILEKISHNLPENFSISQKSLITKYRFSLAQSLMDLELHDSFNPYEDDLISFANQTFAKAYLVADQNQTASLTSFRHIMMGYDASYYVYLWSEALGADMAKVFSSSPQGFLSVAVGRSLREKIYEKGDTEEAFDLVERFLERPFQIESFIQKISAK